MIQNATIQQITCCYFSVKQNKTSKKSNCYFTTVTYLGVTFTKEYSNSCLQLEPIIYLPVPVRIPYTQYFMLIPLFTRLLSRTLV